VCVRLCVQYYFYPFAPTPPSNIIVHTDSVINMPSLLPFLTVSSE
jgi:hypothetical protein